VNTLKTIPLVCVIAVLVACSSTESDWSKAQAANTAAAYQNFLREHPGGAHAQEANDRLQKIQDDEAWSDAQQSNSLAAYQQYLQKEPNGAHGADQVAKHPIALGSRRQTDGRRLIAPDDAMTPP